jgi:hypothetical protein
MFSTISSDMAILGKRSSAIVAIADAISPIRNIETVEIVINSAKTEVPPENSLPRVT